MAQSSETTPPGCGVPTKWLHQGCSHSLWDGPDPKAAGSLQCHPTLSLLSRGRGAAVALGGLWPPSPSRTQVFLAAANGAIRTSSGIAPPPQGVQCLTASSKTPLGAAVAPGLPLGWHKAPGWGGAASRGGTLGGTRAPADVFRSAQSLEKTYIYSFFISGFRLTAPARRCCPPPLPSPATMRFLRAEPWGFHRQQPRLCHGVSAKPAAGFLPRCQPGQRLPGWGTCVSVAVLLRAVCTKKPLLCFKNGIFFF